MWCVGGGGSLDLIVLLVGGVNIRWQVICSGLNWLFIIVLVKGVNNLLFGFLYVEIKVLYFVMLGLIFFFFILFRIGVVWEYYWFLV